MFVVGIASLAGAIDVEVQSLAADLGMTAYDARQLLLPGLPAPILFTTDKNRALALLGSVRGRGNEAVAFDSSAVVSSGAMLLLRRFHLGEEGLVVDGPTADHCRYEDLRVLLRATHEVQFENNSEQTERKFSAGRALLSGGLVVTKKESSKSTSRGEDKREVLYLFRRGGKAPWLLPDSGVRYDWLGDRMAPTERANFLTVIAMLNERAVHAVYDERLVGRKVPTSVCQASVTGIGGNQSFASSTAAGMDLVAHMLAMVLSKKLG